MIFIALVLLALNAPITWLCAVRFWDKIERLRQRFFYLKNPAQVVERIYLLCTDFAHTCFVRK